MPALAAMAGSSIAGRDAAPWVTDFLNAAYFRRSEPDVDDLRLAFCVLTTYWWRRGGGRRLRVTDVPAFHRAFGRARIGHGGTLDRAALLDGAATLVGDWFPDAYADDARRGWGIAFPDVAECAAYAPGRRLALAAIGELTAPAPDTEPHTYDSVELRSAQAALDALARPETWPDYASETGRFTPLRPGGLEGQTFEIEVAAATDTAVPLFTRGYVTVTRVGAPAPWAMPDGATAVGGVELTTHEGHFLGAGVSRLVVYEHDGRAWIRDVGTWDPLPARLAAAYRLAGREAQRAFWGTDPRRSMLVQLARQLA